ncbi:MAG: DUF3995 domain-containing protein [Tepidiformaceae bacterium]
MRTAVSRLTALTLATIALVHVYWAFGGDAGAGAAVPTREGVPAFEPGPVATLAVAGGLASCAIAITAASIGASWGRVVALLAGVVFAARAVGNFGTVGLFKRERGSTFARNDTWLYTPLCLALSAGSLLAATTSPRKPI